MVDDDTQSAKMSVAGTGEATSRKGATATSSNQNQDKETVPAIPARIKKEKACNTMISNMESSSCNSVLLFYAIILCT